MPHNTDSHAFEAGATMLASASRPIVAARAAYARYGAVVGFKNFQGNPMPTFDELPELIQKAWVAAGNIPDRFPADMPAEWKEVLR